LYHKKHFSINYFAVLMSRYCDAFRPYCSS